MTTLAEAEEQAVQAADAAGVLLREVDDVAGFVAVEQLFDSIWRPEPHSQPVTSHLLRALTKAGNYVSAAYRQRQMVGACVGFFGPPGEASMHSHIAGVVPDLAGRHVGYALKQHQRAWALQRGVQVIEWTFDPLVSRNAYFNLAKLGASAVEYLPNFYGSMPDGINGDDDTDRLLVRWELLAARPGLMRTQNEVIALGRGEGGAPVAGSADGETLLVAVPKDVEAMRSSDSGLAREWRRAVRDVMVPLLAGGAQITGFDKAGWYVLRRQAR